MTRSFTVTVLPMATAGEERVSTMFIVRVKGLGPRWCGIYHEGWGWGPCWSGMDREGIARTGVDK